jgi:hypothetical protein
MPVQSRFLFKLLKIFRYRHVIPTGFLGGGGRVFYRYFIPTGFLITEIERKNIFNDLAFFTAHPTGFLIAEFERKNIFMNLKFFTLHPASV